MDGFELPLVVAVVVGFFDDEYVDVTAEESLAESAMVWANLPADGDTLVVG